MTTRHDFDKLIASRSEVADKPPGWHYPECDCEQCPTQEQCRTVKCCLRVKYEQEKADAAIRV